MKKFINISAVLILGLITLFSCVHNKHKSEDVNPIYLQNPPAEKHEQRSTSASKAPSVYQIDSQNTCAGLPRIKSVKLAAGFCLGIVDNGEGLEKPRYALEIDQNNILLTEMGGWPPNKGLIYLLTSNNGTWSRKLLIHQGNVTSETKCILDRTHQIIRGPENEIYVTSAKCVVSIDPLAANPVQSLQIKLKDLPNDGLHPIKVIAFDSSNNMYMNVGSITDNCENTKTALCEELKTRSLIRKYNYLGNGKFDAKFSVFATGQRNSMALHWDENSQSLWAAENARDYIDRKDPKQNGKEKPSDEFNILKEGTKLDWPYCYESGVKSPEFVKYKEIDCAKFTKPHLLLPAHSAPLGMLKYTGDLFPPWYENRILMSLHGYEKYGHRIVTYNYDGKNRPAGRPLSLVYGWDAKGSQTVGSPVGLTQTESGAVLITEDNSKKVLLLYYNANEGDGTPVDDLKFGNPIDDKQAQKEFEAEEEKRRIAFEAKFQDPNKTPLFSKIQKQVLDANCIACHGEMTYAGGIQILKYDDANNYIKLKDSLWNLLNGHEGRQMPPGGLPDETREELLKLVKDWMDAGMPRP